MSYGERIGSYIAHTRAALRRWRGRRLRPALVLLVALVVLLAEPLACVLHCQIYVPWLQRSQHVHVHMHAHMAAAATSSAALPQVSASAPVLPASPNCFQMSGQGTPEPSVPPSPIHEIVLIAALLWIGVAQAHPLRLRAPPHLRGGSRVPPTPPPRLLAHSI